MNIHTFTQALAGALGAHPLLERLFFASVELAALALLLSVLVRLLRIRSPRLISFLLLIALIKPVITLTLGSAFPIVVLKQAENSSVQHGTRFDAAGRSDRIPGDIAAVPEGAVTEATTASQSMANEPAAPAAPNFAKWSWQEVIIGFWLGGAALFCASYGIARVQLFRIKRNALAPSEDAAARYHKEANALSLTRRPELLVSDLLESPALVGLFQPTVLLPAWLAATPDDPKFQWAVRHELTHWKWLDPLPIALRDLARILFYFHPAVWWIGRKLIESIELACDRALIRNASEANAYAEQLFQILREIRDRRRVPIAGGLFATRTQIGKRIEVLLEGTLLRVPQLSILSIAGLGCFGAVAISLGGAVGTAEVQTSEDQKAAVIAEIEKLRGKVKFDETRQGRPVISVDFFINDEDWWKSNEPLLKVTDEMLRRFQVFTQLEELDLTDARISDEGLAHLKPLTKLKKLSLLSTRVNGSGLRHLTSLTNLTDLDLWDTQVTDAGLSHVKDFANLETLRLNHAKNVTDIGLGHVSRLTRLKNLGLGSTAITDAGLAHLTELANLEKIELWRTQVGDPGLAHLKHFTRLKHLELNQSKITDASWDVLVGLTNLTHLRLSGTGVTDGGLVHLKKLRQLEALHLGGSKQVTDFALQQLQDLPKLKVVSLNDGIISEAGLTVLESLPPVEITSRGYWTPFTLSGPTITDASLSRLKRLSKLKALSLKNTKITEAGIAHLRGIPGLEVLHLAGNQITDSFLIHLRDLPDLKGLFLSDSQVSDVGIENLKESKKLQVLDLNGARITDAGLAHLSRLSELSYLFLGRTQASDSGMASLRKLSKLSLLDLSNTRVSDVGLVQISDLPELSSLVLSETGITDAGLVRLARLQKLVEVRVNGTKVTTAGIEALKKQIPNLHVTR